MPTEVKYCVQDLRNLLWRDEDLKASSVTSLFENISVSGPVYGFKTHNTLEYACMRACMVCSYIFIHKVNFTLVQATKGQRGFRSINILFFDHCARWVGWST